MYYGYYENGYEKISPEQLALLVGGGYAQAPVPVKYIGIKYGSLRIVGESENVRAALSFLNSSLDVCGGGSGEFSLHFFCEEKFGVRIFKVQNTVVRNVLCAC